MHAEELSSAEMTGKQRNTNKSTDQLSSSVFGGDITANLMTTRSHFWKL